MENCPRCSARLDRSDRLIPGALVYRCYRCRKFAAEVPGVTMEWIDGGPGVVERMEGIIAESVRTARAATADDDDPIWGAMG